MITVIDALLIGRRVIQNSFETWSIDTASARVYSDQAQAGVCMFVDVMPSYYYSHYTLCRSTLQKTNEAGSCNYH